ncbi:unnamed protein product [Mytilus edulis]|uniref:Uncharacterized protein n=1 Tax=Mytilus edulis TaxID=6550 RepID=A0A8S3SDU8_MYTED|nr:unnamed protein product [Mytilus edulis]
MGQSYSIQTFDQQLYAIAKQVEWAMPETFKTHIIRLGGFHTLSCFIASIGKLWGDGGLKDLLIDSSVYAAGTVDQMMCGKQFNRASKDDQDKAIDILKSTESHPKLKSEFLLLVEPDQIIKFSVKNQDVDDKLQNTCTENVTITRNSVLNLANDDRGNKSELTWHYKEDAYLGNENRNKEFKHGGGDYIEKTLKKDVSKYLCGF